MLCLAIAITILLLIGLTITGMSIYCIKNPVYDKEDFIPMILAGGILIFVALAIINNIFINVFVCPF